MKPFASLSFAPAVLAALVPLSPASAQPAISSSPYKIIASVRYPGSGGIDYVTADSENRRLYVPRGNEVLAFDLDTLKPAGAIANTRAHGVAVDPKSHHAFSSSNPVAMWDASTLAMIKTIPVQGRPDGILFEPASECIYVFSHSAPNATVIAAKEGAIVGTIDLGGAPEQAASDGRGHLYVDIESKDNIAVVDTATRSVTAHYSLGGKASAPAGLGFDARNQILFVFCRNPQTCVVMSAIDGKIITTLPIGHGTDGGGFNPATMEAFSSQGDGTLTIIKENNPTSFEVEQTVETKPRAKTCALDSKKNHIVLIAIEPMPSSTEAKVAAPVMAEPAAKNENGRPTWKRGGGGGPGLLDILVVGR